MIQLRLLEHRLLRYAGITLGCLIASCSINLFLVPSHLLTGGATGIAMIVYYLTHLPIGAQTFAYNIPLLWAAWRLLGKGYTCDVIIGTAIFSFCLDFTKPLNDFAPVSDYMLAAIFGGVFNGIGYGIVFRMNGSTGGFDIVGAIAKKFYSFNMGGVIFGFNCLVMLAAAFMFGVAPAMFTLICMFMNAMVTDKVIAGFNSRKALLIVSNQAEAIAEGMVDMGLMKGCPRDIAESGAYALVFPCGTGHMMGLDVHNMENLGEQYVGYAEGEKKSTQFGFKSLRLARPLEPGFIFTVEPGIYFIPELIDLWKAEGRFKEFINYDKFEAWKGFGGLRNELDYLITEDGCRVLGTLKKPMTLDEVYAAKQG